MTLVITEKETYEIPPGCLFCDYSTFVSMDLCGKLCMFDSGAAVLSYPKCNSEEGYEGTLRVEVWKSCVIVHRQKACLM